MVKNQTETLPYMSLTQTCLHLKLTKIQLRPLIAFVPTSGHPGHGSYFPNSYKPTKGINSHLRIATKDIDRYKEDRAGRYKTLIGQDPNDEPIYAYGFIYDLPFMYIDEAAKVFDMHPKQVHYWLTIGENGRASKDSIFPNAYKETPAQTSRIRIPVSDVDAHRAKTKAGFGSNGCSVGESSPLK